MIFSWTFARQRLVCTSYYLPVISIKKGYGLNMSQISRPPKQKFHWHFLSKRSATVQRLFYHIVTWFLVQTGSLLSLHCYACSCLWRSRVLQGVVILLISSHWSLHQRISVASAKRWELLRTPSVNDSTALSLEPCATPWWQIHLSRIIYWEKMYIYHFGACLCKFHGS